MEGREVERIQAVERFRNGESVEAICSSLRRSRSWFYKWLNRADGVSDPWYADQSRRPHENERYDEVTRELLIDTRQRLEKEGCFVSAQMISWELESEEFEVPSIATIKRILKAAGLTGRNGGTPKGTRYPAPAGTDPGSVHQADFVGPRHVNRVRFYSLNAVDVSTARAADEPLVSRATEHVVPGLWSIWRRLGIPRILQLDNELVFFGNRRYPRAIGQVPRLCFQMGVEVMFIPIREPWRNSIVEKFNDHWNRKLYRRITVHSFEHLRSEALHFEQRHNSTWRYSKLNGQTPNHALAASTVKLRFPESATPPPMPYARPTRGRLSFIRLIRSDQRLEIFGQYFAMPPEATHEYVRATIDLEAQRIDFVLHGQLIQTQPYIVR